jgi:hypothetical protein
MTSGIAAGLGPRPWPMPTVCRAQYSQVYRGALSIPSDHTIGQMTDIFIKYIGHFSGCKKAVAMVGKFESPQAERIASRPGGNIGKNFQLDTTKKRGCLR